MIRCFVLAERDVFRGKGVAELDGRFYLGEAVALL